MKLAQVILDHPTFKGVMIDFFQKNLPEYDFDFYVIDKNASPLLSGYLSDPKDGVVFKRTTSNREGQDFVNQILDEHDFVMFHSMMLSPQVKANVLSHNKSNIQKIIWIEWGYDLYISRGRGIADLARFIAKKIMLYRFDRRIPFFIAIHPSDLDEYKRLIHGNAYLNWVPYLGRPNPTVPPEKKKRVLMEDKHRAGQPITIQIGQRAWKGLNHSKWLQRLSKYQNENIRVFLPLSYGDRTYGDLIQKEAIRLFGDKAVVLRDVLPLEEYRALLADVDIFILDSKRQIALGNIHPLLRNQKKIFMPSDSSLSRYFRSQDVEIFDIDTIGRIPFSAFIQDPDMTGAIRFMDRYDTFDNVSRWREILSDISERIHE